MRGSPASGTGVRRACLLVLASLSAFTACGRGADEPVRIEERDGVVWVHNRGPGLWAGREPLPLRFELEQIFGADQEPEAAMLGNVAGVAVDADGNVYVVDRQINRLVAFAPDGRHRWTAGREGEGPAELQRPRGIVWDGEGSLFVANQGGTRLDQWGLDGVHQRNLSLNEVGLGGGNLQGALPPATAVFSRNKGGAIGGTITLVELGESLEKVAEFEVDLTPSDMSIPPGGSFGIALALGDDTIHVGHTASYELRFFDAGGRLLRVITRDIDLVRPGVAIMDGGGWGIGSFSSLGAPLELPSGHLLTQASWPTNVDDPDAWLLRDMTSEERLPRERTETLDLFDDEGRLLLSLVGEQRTEIGNLRLVGPDGKLYTTAGEPWVQVRRYRVVVDE